MKWPLTAIAAVMKVSKPIDKSPQAMQQWRQDVRSVARVGRYDDPQFDYAQFYDACGYEYDKKKLTPT